MIHAPPVKVPTGETSAPPVPREESLAKDRLNIVLIPPGSIRLSTTTTDPPVQFKQPLEVNLTEVHIDQLHRIQQQLSAELRSRVLATYQQNAQLKQKNTALATSYQKKVDELNTYLNKIRNSPRYYRILHSNSLTTTSSLHCLPRRSYKDSLI